MIEQANITEQSFKGFLANLNLIIIIVGYPLIAVFLIPFFGNSFETTRIVTVPFRFIALLVSLSTLYFHLMDKVETGFIVKVFLLCWIFILLRIFYDLEYRIDYDISSTFKNQIWMSTVGIVFIPMLSVIKSFNSIHFRSCLIYLQIIGFITLTVGFISFSGDSTSSDRIMGTALDPISFGQLGGIVSILSLLLMEKQIQGKKLITLFYFLSILLGIFISLRTGSRGPVLALILTILLYYIFKSKHMIATVLKIGLPMIIVLLLFSGVLIDMIGYVSPVFESRLTEVIGGEDLSANNRKISYEWFWNEIQDNIFTGSQFARLSNTEYPGYAHNIVLDIMLAFGVWGLGLFLYVLFKTLCYSRMLIRYDSEKLWIGLVAMQYIFLSFFSGAYYSSPVLNVSIALILLAGTSLYRQTHE